MHHIHPVVCPAFACTLHAVPDAIAVIGICIAGVPHADINGIICAGCWHCTGRCNIGCIVRRLVGDIPQTLPADNASPAINIQVGYIFAR